MAKGPKKVHPDHSRAPGLGIEEMSTQIAINGQHDLRGREWTDSQNYQSCHDEIEPNEKRHLPQLHTGTTQAENRHNDVDRSSDTAKSRNQQAQGPEIRTMTD